MAVRVRLQDIIEGMEFQSDEMTSYLNRKTGEVVTVGDEYFRALEFGDEGGPRADWEQKEMELARAVQASDDYVALPDRFEIDEYRMMERFAWSCGDPAASERLDRAVRGRGAFRRFKDTVRELGLHEDWYAYRDRGYERVAIDWCDAHGVEYERLSVSSDADA